MDGVCGATHHMTSSVLYKPYIHTLVIRMLEKCVWLCTWQGFYTVYGSLFERLAKQEERAWEERRADAEGSDEERGAAGAPAWPRSACWPVHSPAAHVPLHLSHCDARLADGIIMECSWLAQITLPPLLHYFRFGTSEADAAQVNAFYGHWAHFSTAKTFAWAELYNLASAPNRYTVLASPPGSACCTQMPHVC